MTGGVSQYDGQSSPKSRLLSTSFVPTAICTQVSLAVVTGKLCLTVPWLVEYLSMMDNLAPSLDYFQQVLFLLLYVHRSV